MTKEIEKINVAYLGGIPEIAEFIYHNPYLNLKLVVCELSNRYIMENFSIIRNCNFCAASNNQEILDAINILRDISVIIVSGFGIILRKNIIKEYTCFNIHFSNLPYYKGRHPLYWATVKENLSLGITIHQINEGIDTGNIIAQKLCPYYFWENNDHIYNKLLQEVPNLLDQLILFLNGEVKSIENTTGYYYPPVTTTETTLNLDLDTPSVIFNKVRAQSSYGGVKLVYNNHLYSIKKVHFISFNHYKKIKDENKLNSSYVYIILNTENVLILTDYYIQKTLNYKHE
ncbi:MAG: formyltransferase family protein [Calothrix sp. MO_167.B12]|nr:formyltransferase family protein [Calothrix sp. MO_167.B12]